MRKRRTWKVLLAVDSLSKTQATALDDAIADWGTLNRIPQAAPVAQFREHLNSASIVIGWPEPEWLSESGVRLLLLPASGYNRYLSHALRVPDAFTLCNARGVYGVAAAEHVLAMMFALTRRLPEYIQADRATFWSEQTDHCAELQEATICVVGLGDIGTEVARRCLALGMRVKGVRRNPAVGHPLVKTVHGISELKNAVAGADHVVCTLPLSPETEGVFDLPVFEAMKAGSLFYNVSRGGLVDEAALGTAIRSGHLRGAGLDVFSVEPIPTDHPFWSTPGILMTPHVAGRSLAVADRLTHLLADNLRRCVTGEALLNVVSGPTRPLFE